MNVNILMQHYLFSSSVVCLTLSSFCCSSVVFMTFNCRTHQQKEQRHEYSTASEPTQVKHMPHIGSSSVWWCISVFTTKHQATCLSCVHRLHPKSANNSTFVWPVAVYSLCREYSSIRTAVVCLPGFVRPSGMHLATACMIQIAASKA